MSRENLRDVLKAYGTPEEHIDSVIDGIESGRITIMHKSIEISDVLPF